MRRFIQISFPLVVVGYLLSACTTPNASSPRAATPISLPRSYSSLPEPITSFGAIESGGWLYIYGGHLGIRHEYSEDKVSKAFYRLNLADGITWEKLPSLDTAQGTALVAHDGLIYWIGGMYARNKAGEKRDLHSRTNVARFHPAKREWEPLPALPEGRSSHDAVVLGNKLYVGGGWKLGGGTAGAKYHDMLLALDLAKKNAQWEIISQPFKRRALAMAGCGSKIYFIGGMDSEDDVSAEVDVYDTKTKQWAKGPVLPPNKTKGFGASACCVDGEIFVSGMSGVVHQLNDAGTAWETAGTLQTPRIAHRLVTANSEQVLAIAGESEKGHLKDIEVVVVRKN